jgi:hypothetical protein
MLLDAVYYRKRLIKVGTNLPSYQNGTESSSFGLCAERSEFLTVAMAVGVVFFVLGQIMSINQTDPLWISEKFGACGEKSGGGG